MLPISDAHHAEPILAVSAELEGVADILVAIRDAARGNPMILELVSAAMFQLKSAGPVQVSMPAMAAEMHVAA